MSGSNMELDPTFLFAAAEQRVIDGAIPGGVIAFANRADAADVTGAAIQVNGLGLRAPGALLVLDLAAPTGSPTSMTVQLSLQDSPDGTTDWQDITGEAGLTVTTAAVSAFRVGATNVRRSRGYVRWRLQVDFVGGTAPTVDVGQAVVFTRGT